MFNTNLFKSIPYIYISKIPSSRELINPIQESIILYSLVIRRNPADIMFIFYILNGYDICPDILSLIGFRFSYKYTRDIELFVIHLYKTNIGNVLFIYCNIVHIFLDPYGWSIRFHFYRFFFLTLSRKMFKKNR